MKRISILLIFITINSCKLNNDSKYYKNFDFINFKGIDEIRHPFFNFPFFEVFHSSKNTILLKCHLSLFESRTKQFYYENGLWKRTIEYREATDVKEIEIFKGDYIHKLIFFKDFEENNKYSLDVYEVYSMKENIQKKFLSKNDNLVDFAIDPDLILDSLNFQLNCIEKYKLSEKKLKTYVNCNFENSKYSDSSCYQYNYTSLYFFKVFNVEKERCK
ncbi:hypothetical protein [Lacihabitans lacunae]|uniref:Lipoprotein n=1 Tax=Lacihabitans lacunae TaxID=1028214 RepID=A0ABV7Z3R4_9BACT